MKALALKYRPKSFDELIGQDIVASSLSHALNSGRLGHAYLFSGLRGSGKTSSARIFAKALLCEAGVSAHPCETCENCKMANEGRHMDIIEMDAASHRKIDDIRELIEHTKYSPSSARFKIFIIDEVHMLTREAFNALLKTLEEPPEYVKFILATTDPLKLPATILSRTQHFRFKPISKNDIVKHLEFIMNKEGIPFEPKALEILSRSGSGSLRDTLTLLDQAIIFSRESVTQKAVTDMLGLLDPDQIEKIINVISSRDKNELLALLRELSGSDAELIIDELIINLKDKFINQNSEFSLLVFERFFRVLSEAKSMLSLGSDPEFTLYVALFMMLEAFNLTDINDAINENLAPKTTSISSVLAPKPAQIIPQKPAQKSPYEMFVAGIYDRDYELGKCFDECIEFVEYKDDTLVLSSSASGQNQEILRKSSKIIMEILKKSFSQTAKIQIKKADDAPKTNEEKVNDAMQKLLATSANLEVNKKDIEPANSAVSSEEIKPVNLEANLQNTPAKEPTKISLDNIKNDESSNIKSNIKELSRLFGEPEIIRNN